MVEYSEAVGYPHDALPVPQANFNGSFKAPVQTTNFASGKIRRRKTGRTTVKSVNIEWLFTPEEYDFFERWWDNDLESGVLKFKINMCTGGYGQTGEHVVQFVSDPNFSHEESNWRVSVEAIIHPYPTKSDDSVLEMYLGEPLDLFYPIYVNYLNEEYV